MDLILGFVKSHPFYDDKNFPYGISKSGFFSIEESDVLTKLGNRLFSLEQGVATSANQVEENFVLVCLKEREADTKVELLWQKYKKNTGRKSLKTLGGNIAEQPGFTMPKEGNQ
jgi:uncharacterized protein YifE (UPF0438 family)